jgi:hypothetical protein
VRKDPLGEGVEKYQETIQATVNQDEKADCGNRSKNPFPSFKTKTTTPHEVGKELPINIVISLFQV